MVLLGRLEFVLAMIARGRHVRVSAAYSKDSSQNKVKIDIGPWDDTVPVDARRLCRQMVLALAAEVQLCTTVDRGHKHSDQRSHIDLWMKPRGASHVEPSVADGDGTKNTSPTSTDVDNIKSDQRPHFVHVAAPLDVQGHDVQAKQESQTDSAVAHGPLISPTVVVSLSEQDADLNNDEADHSTSAPFYSSSLADPHTPHTLEDTCLTNPIPSLSPVPRLREQLVPGS